MKVIECDECGSEKPADFIRQQRDGNFCDDCVGKKIPMGLETDDTVRMEIGTMTYYGDFKLGLDIHDNVPFRDYSDMRDNQAEEIRMFFLTIKDSYTVVLDFTRKEIEWSSPVLQYHNIPKTQELSVTRCKPLEEVTKSTTLD